MTKNVKNNSSTSSNDSDIEKLSTNDKNYKCRNLIAYWILGLCNNYGYVVMLSAAHDILHNKFGEVDASISIPTSNFTVDSNNTRTCNTVSTGAILLADIVPALIIKSTAPFLPFFVHVRIALSVFLAGVGLILVSMSTSEYIAILGVVFTSFSSGLGECTLISYCHRFSKSTISSWSSGTGGAGIIGAISYAGLTMWFSTEETLLLMLVMPVLQAITFWLLLVHPAPEKAPPVVNVEDGSQEQLLPVPKKTFKEKVRLIPSLMGYMIPLTSIYLFEYFINQGLYELIEFKSTWLSHGEQYRWMQVDYQIGVFISRSSVSFLVIDNIVIMAVLQLVNVFIFLFETLFYFVPNIWIIFGLVFWEGLLGGSAYVNTFYKISRKVPREDRESALGIVAMADTVGIALAGYLSMPVHNAICMLPQPRRIGS